MDHLCDNRDLSLRRQETAGSPLLRLFHAPIVMHLYVLIVSKKRTIDWTNCFFYQGAIRSQ